MDIMYLLIRSCQQIYTGNDLCDNKDKPGDPFHNIKDKMDIFIVGHLFGYWCKTLIFRDWWLSTGENDSSTAINFPNVKKKHKKCI
jgi:hypothetical protein